jgi:hypothetical protein
MVVIPAYLQAAYHNDLKAAGTLLRFDHDGATHGLVVGQHDGKIIVFTGNSRSEVLNCNGEEECWLLSETEFNELDPVYDGKVVPPSRVVSIDKAQAQPKKLPYDPSQPGQYFYIERPIEEAPPAQQVDESSLPEFMYQQKLPVTKDKRQPSVMPKLRSDLSDPVQMSKALAIHIYQLEELHKITVDFASGVNASMDYVRRGEEQVEHRGAPTEIKQLAPFTHRDPAGHPIQPEKRPDWVKAQKALVLLDKVRSGLETTGLLVVQFRSVVYELKKEIDNFTIYNQHETDPRVLKYRNWAMTYDEFAREWSLRLVKERRQVQDAASALQKAWQRYREKTALYVQRLVTRYAQKHDGQSDDVIESINETKNDVDNILAEIQEITSAYDDYSSWLDRLASSHEEHETQLMVAASLKQIDFANTVFYVDEFVDAEPLKFKTGKNINTFADSLSVIDSAGACSKVNRGMLITGQAERIRRKKRTPTIIPIEQVKEVDAPSLEDILTPIETPPQSVKQKTPKKPEPKKQKAPTIVPVSTPPEQIPVEPVKPQIVDVKGKPVPVIQPTQLVKQKPPPPPTRVLPPIPTPDEQEPVDFSDIPEEEWKAMSAPEKIRMAAVFRRIVLMEYMKITPPEEGVQKNYLLEIYSYRVKRPQRTGGSPVWYLYGHDINDGHIKAFILRRIKSIEILDEKFEPRWEIEFAFNPQWNKYRKPKQPKPGIEVEQTDQPFFE